MDDNQEKEISVEQENKVVENNEQKIVELIEKTIAKTLSKESEWKSKEAELNETIQKNQKLIEELQQKLSEAEKHNDLVIETSIATPKSKNKEYFNF